MELDYDIYSYLAFELAIGNLQLRLAHEKVTYEIVDIDLIDLNQDNSPIIRYKLHIIGKNGKKLLNNNRNHIVIYENMKSLNENYKKIPGKKNLLAKKQKNISLIQIPKSIKLPTDKGTFKMSKIEAGKWIDVTDLDNLKIYSDKRCNEIFEFKDDEVQIRRNNVKKFH